MPEPHFQIKFRQRAAVLRLCSGDGMNRLTRGCVVSLTEAVDQLGCENHALVITGNESFFSVGADLNEIAALNGPLALEFARMGQRFMQRLQDFPAPVIAAISGYCMGGGFDLALACHHRIAAPNAVFGHRGAALGLITGWGGTQRLPRLVGKGQALQMFVAAEKVSAEQALRIGLIDAIENDPVAAALQRIGP
jgi:enoyl-CoA hydratase/carnithine racemase